MSKKVESPLSESKKIPRKMQLDLEGGSRLMSELFNKREKSIKRAIRQLTRDPHALVRQAKEIGLSTDIETLYKNPDDYDETACQQQAQELASQLILAMDAIHKESKYPVPHPVAFTLKHLMSGGQSAVADEKDGLVLFYEGIQSIRKIKTISDSHLPKEIDSIQKTLESLNIAYEPFNSSADMRAEMNRLNIILFKNKLEKFPNLEKLCRLFNIQGNNIDAVISKAIESVDTIKIINYGIPIKLALFIQKFLFSPESIQSSQSEFSIFLSILKAMNKNGLDKSEKFKLVAEAILQDKNNLINIAHLLRMKPNKVFLDASKVDALAMEVLVTQKERSFGTGVPILQSSSIKFKEGQKITEEKEVFAKKKVTKQKEIKTATRHIGDRINDVQPKALSVSEVSVTDTVEKVAAEVETRAVKVPLSKPSKKSQYEKRTKSVKAHQEFMSAMKTAPSQHHRRALLFNQWTVQKKQMSRHHAQVAKHDESVGLLSTAPSARHIRHYLFSKQWETKSCSSRASSVRSRSSESVGIRSFELEAKEISEFIRDVIQVAEKYGLSWGTSFSMLFDLWDKRSQKKNSREKVIQTFVYHLKLIQGEKKIDEVVKFKMILTKISTLMRSFDATSQGEEVGSQDSTRIELGSVFSKYIKKFLDRLNLDFGGKENSNHIFRKIEQLWQNPKLNAKNNLDAVVKLRTDFIHLICERPGSMNINRYYAVMKEVALLEHAQTSASCSL